MKLVMDEKLKHRLIGLAVIISLGAIFAPAMMRKSSQHLDNNFSVNIKLPPKPLTPDVAATDEKDMFKTIKVARVHVPPVPAPAANTGLARAEPISNKGFDSRLAALEADKKTEQIKLALLKETAKSTANKVVIAANTAKLNKVAKVSVNTKVAKAATKSTKTVYAVQLASFSQLSNAQSLVTRLQNKGYKANYIRVSGRKGAIYKVYAGHSQNRNEVLRVKTQLASAMRLNGFVVNTGVS